LPTAFWLPLQHVLRRADPALAHRLAVALAVADRIAAPTAADMP